MGVGSIIAIPAAGLELDDIDVLEINEAFASQFVYCHKKLDLDLEKINVNRGAMAIGHLAKWKDDIVFFESFQLGRENVQSLASLDILQSFSTSEEVYESVDMKVVLGVVFTRGPVLAVLILLKSKGETYVVLIEQISFLSKAKVPTGRVVLELPVGMLDDDQGDFVSTTVCEICKGKKA
ncbi:hypothetical protein SLEP1_g4680 [Rubroshorea leprosula]|uniref:Thiolase C-terminal domain-containing protein n=1 Tax=Rubroshorea leprosula TaxID=152421 RepID=A0AAV5HVA1_9ROSI|nr:hypothetical protein SLEP1_g4680 [Rubroshorea leprosula]